MNTMNIEGKVPIAADAAQLVIAYLDELNIKLVQAGVKNSYLIVADVESMIIEALKRQGKTTKLGNEEVLKIITDEFDDPDEFIKIYMADMNPKTYEEKVDKFMVDPNQRRLIRRSRSNNQQINENNKSIFTTIFYNTIVPATLILMFIAIILNVVSSFDNNFDYMIGSFVFTVLAAVIFIFIELLTGKNGRLIVNIKDSIEHRYFFRGLYISNFILTWFKYGTFFNNWYQYHRSYSGWSGVFEAILVTYTVLFVFLEFSIFIRDHLPNYFPLEPEYRKIIRLITPPYLLIMFGLFFMIVLNIKYALLMTGSFMVLAGILWAAFRKYRVSSRFYLVSATTIFSAGITINDDVPLVIFPYAIAGLAALLVFKIFTKSTDEKGSFINIKKMYSDYYDDKGVNE